MLMRFSHRYWKMYWNYNQGSCILLISNEWFKYHIFLLSAACAQPLGLENKHISDAYLSGSEPSFHRFRLNNNDAWRTNPYTMDNQEFVQVTLTPYGKTVTALAFEGLSAWAMSFTLSTSEDGSEWQEYTFQGKIEVRSESYFF